MTIEGDRLIIAGGGLSGCLAALALAHLQPKRPFLLVESADAFGGNHLWSFFDPDVPKAGRWLVDPLVERRWNDHEVRFPARQRILPTPYNSVTSARLDAVVRERLGSERYRLGSRIENVAPDHVVLAGGERLAAAGVIDARGPARLPALDLGWQKFVGREYRFDRPHRLARPIIMDATVDQDEGYRFVYCLPFSEREMLVEDTYYSLSATLDPVLLGSRLDAYVRDRGWTPVGVSREESGVLPVAMGGSVERLWDEDPGIPKLGLRGGFFHPTTGYSLPDAVRTALIVASQRDHGGGNLHRQLHRESVRLWNRRGFYRLLNRMLFLAAAPPDRYRVLEHFYRLPPPLIARFYAGRSTALDKVRILTGKPPVPVGRALAALRGRPMVAA